MPMKKLSVNTNITYRMSTRNNLWCLSFAEVVFAIYTNHGWCRQSTSDVIWEMCRLRSMMAAHGWLWLDIVYMQRVIREGQDRLPLSNVHRPLLIQPTTPYVCWAMLEASINMVVNKKYLLANATCHWTMKHSWNIHVFNKVVCHWQTQMSLRLYAQATTIVWRPWLMLPVVGNVTCLKNTGRGWCYLTLNNVSITYSMQTLHGRCVYAFDCAEFYWQMLLSRFSKVMCYAYMPWLMLPAFGIGY